MPLGGTGIDIGQCRIVELMLLLVGNGFSVGGRKDEAGLQAWSNDGGTVEIAALSADWGPLGLGLGGTLALDPDLQPIASFSANITGFTETLTALAATRVVKPSSAALASIGLGLLAKPEGPNNAPTVTVPVTIQNGLVYLSSFKLTKLPKLRLY